MAKYFRTGALARRSSGATRSGIDRDGAARRRGRSRSGRTVRSWWKRWLQVIVLVILGAHLLAATALSVLRFVDPPTTGVQMQRRVEAWWAWASSFGEAGAYSKRQSFVPMSAISPYLQHAAIAAEDGRFYVHHGIDFDELQKVLEDSVASGESPRGASTITQQLVKNLFFTTHRNPLRKLAEYSLAPMADFILGKPRVLELYLNVIEWGPGVYGAEAASRYHYGVAAAKITRDQASRLAACIPAPRQRRPPSMDRYSGIIRQRMQQMNW